MQFILVISKATYGRPSAQSCDLAQTLRRSLLVTTHLPATRINITHSTERLGIRFSNAQKISPTNFVWLSKIFIVLFSGTIYTVIVYSTRQPTTLLCT